MNLELLGDCSKVEELLRRVAQEFLRKDSDLLHSRANERTVTHRIGHYLQLELPQRHVDCEYNRVGKGRETKHSSKGARRFPDIIVHLRGDGDHNDLVIEAKAAWAPKANIRADREKLDWMSRDFNYRFAYLLVYEAKPEPKLTWVRIRPQLDPTRSDDFSVPLSSLRGPDPARSVSSCLASEVSKLWI